MVMGHPLRGRQALNWPACSRASRDDDTRWDLVFAWTARKLAWYHLPTLTVDRDRVYVYYTLRRVLLLWESVAVASCLHVLSRILPCCAEHYFSNIFKFKREATL